jgi:hypothetical protein
MLALRLACTLRLGLSRSVVLMLSEHNITILPVCQWRISLLGNLDMKAYFQAFASRLPNIARAALAENRVANVKMGNWCSGLISSSASSVQTWSPSRQRVVGHGPTELRS